MATSVVGGWVRLTPGRSTSLTESQSDNDAPKGKSVFFTCLLYIMYVCSTFYAFSSGEPRPLDLLHVVCFYILLFRLVRAYVCYILGFVFGFLCAGSDVSSLMPGLTRGQTVLLCL